MHHVKISMVHIFWCARWAHVLTGESPQSARQWEGYSWSQGCPPRGGIWRKD